MTTKLEKSIMVNVPVRTAYNQWTQFEEFPQFMSGVKKVAQLGDSQLEWVAEILGVRRHWKAEVLEQVPDRKVAWAATEGATKAGAVTFEDVGSGQTAVHLSLEYEPHGFLEGLGDKLHIVEKQAEGDLGRFKAFIESEGYSTGAWRGSVKEGRPVVTPRGEHAATSRDDSGKAGVSGASVVTGAAVLAGGAAAAAAAKKSNDSGMPAEELYPPVAPADYGSNDEQPVTTSTITDSPLPAPGRANVVYPTDPEAVQHLDGLEADFDPDKAARRSGETLGGNVTPNPRG